MKPILTKPVGIPLLLTGFAAFGLYLNYENSNSEFEPTKSENRITNLREKTLSIEERAATREELLAKPPKRTNRPGPANEISQLKRYIDKLDNRIDALANQVAGQAATVPATPADTVPELTEQEREAQARQQMLDQLALFDKVATQEGIDEEWALDAQADVYESFQNLADEGLGLAEVKCHSSFCEADFSFAAEQGNEGIKRLVEVSPWEGEAMIWVDNINEGKGVIYLAREGQSLPLNDSPL